MANQQTESAKEHDESIWKLAALDCAGELVGSGLTKAGEKDGSQISGYIVKNSSSEAKAKLDEEAKKMAGNKKISEGDSPVMSMSDEEEREILSGDESDDTVTLSCKVEDLFFGKKLKCRDFGREMMELGSTLKDRQIAGKRERSRKYKLSYLAIESPFFFDE